MPVPEQILRIGRPSVAVIVPVFAAVLAGLAGCSVASAGTSKATQSHAPSAHAAAGWPDAVPKSGLSKGMVLPLEAYMETYPESVTVDRAVQRLQIQCMARFGFTYNPPPPDSVPPPSNDDSNMGRRYGIMDPASAARLGYSLGDEDATPPPAPRLSPAAYAVLSGRVSNRPNAPKAPSTADGKPIPAGGCAAEAANRIGAAIDTHLPGRLDADSLDKSQADPRVQQGIHNWSACMKAKGYTVDNPLDAAKLAPHSQGLPVSENEISVATSDVACKAKTGLVRTWFDVESQIQRTQIEQNQLALVQVRDRINAAVKAAAVMTG